MSYQRWLSILLCGTLAVLAGCSEDTNPPRIIAAVPGDGSFGFPRNSLISVQFNENLLASSIPDDSITVFYNGQPIPGSVHYEPFIKTIAFRPDEPLFFLREYEAFLEKGVTDEKGNALAEGIQWGFRIGDGTFGEAGLLEQANDGDAITPQIVIGPNNNSMIIWAQTELETVAMVGTLHRNILARAFTNDYVDIVRTIETNADAADAPQVTMDAAGNSVAVWSQSDGTRTNIWANRYTLPPPPVGKNPPANGWGTAVLIETDNAGDAGSPQVAVDSDGNVIAVWSQSDGTRTNIWANRFNGSAWSTAELIESDNAGDATMPQIAIDGDDNAFAVWTQSDGTRTNIWANRFTGSWAGPVLIETDNAGDAAAPQIVADSDGDTFIVVWSQSDAAHTNIWANRYSGGSWAGPVSLETLDGPANTPEITMNAAGNAIGIWSQLVDADAPTDVTVTIASPGVVSWAAHRLVNGNKVVLETTGSLPTGLTAGTTYYVRNQTTNSFELSATPGGASINTSGTQSGTHTAIAPRFRIYANHCNPSGVWETARLIESTPSADSVKPQIVIDADGNALGLWTIEIMGRVLIDDVEVLVTHEEVAANRYRAFVDTWGLWGFIENDDVASNSGNARGPQIAMAPDFTAVAVWSKASRFDVENDDETDRYSIQFSVFD